MTKLQNKIKTELLREYIEDALNKLGVNSELTNSICSALIKTTQWGIDTHGIRLFPTYVKELIGGRAIATNQMDAVFVSNAMVKLDAKQNLGVLAGFKAAELAREIAQSNGCGIVSVSNSNHFGAAQLYARQLAKHDLVGLVMTNAAPRVVPFNGHQQLFGTNPICFTAPAQNEVFCLDMATSQSSYSKVKGFIRDGKVLPDSWVATADDTAPNSLSDIVGLLPLGGYKGQGLAMMVEILCSTLAGSLSGCQMSHLDTEPYDQPRDVSHFVLAIDPAKFTPIEAFKSALSEYLSAVRNSTPAGAAQILTAGQQELYLAETRQQFLSMTEFEIEDFASIESSIGVARSIHTLIE
ncbi:Ldh family oxidoreductase [Pseudoalteromonas aurantia]|uniref:Delta1-piperideine-2-carboxylate reductase n=1 Tax=Pseudoalteromonas aurantia 208 TaxID=1314867 RepID=A0ABR9EGA0_9GAMM|nr:Ldh family oxidoreductase [Pseudoalteromonas aurantia]MBE0369939.1 delta1-piperideine-2-carboxylate reductase [Pseudoalteromonas aurantia 208]